MMCEKRCEMYEELRAQSGEWREMSGENGRMKVSDIGAGAKKREEEK